MLSILVRYKHSIVGLTATMLLFSAGCANNRDAQTKVEPPAKPAADIGLSTPAELAVWPWPKAVKDTPHPGVTHWLARSQDGTTCDLMRFDFNANPALRFELYSQDEDDPKPFDNSVMFWPMGVGQATRHLNQRLAKQKGGKIVAAWNGPFFGYYRKAPIPKETAFHLAPIVLRGKVLYNTGNHRWTFGVQYKNGKPLFKVFHLPGRKQLEREFDFAGGAIQCLIKDGQPLKAEHFPTGPTDFKVRPVASTPQDLGHIPYFDHARFSRASMAWSKDSSVLYLLVVREPNTDSEGASIERLQKWQPQKGGGWTVPDLQKFWIAMQKDGRIWNAVNSDAGDVAQLAYSHPADKNTLKYTLISPIGDHPKFERREFTPDFKSAPAGGGLMYFYVRDSSG